MSLINQLSFVRDHVSAVTPYLKDRGFTDATIAEFELGYCPEGGAPAELHPFRGRLMVPINNLQGDIVGFGARTLKDEKPKYVNSYEGPLYHKSRLLYNLDRAQDSILRDGYAICCEGYFDVMALWQAGIRNVVASCGTALTRHQIRLLKRSADKVVVLYDGDNAGRAAAERAVEGLGDEMISIVHGILPAGEDPDSYLRTAGKAALLEVIRLAK